VRFWSLCQPNEIGAGPLLKRGWQNASPPAETWLLHPSKYSAHGFVGFKYKIETSLSNSAVQWESGPQRAERRQFESYECIVL